MRGANATRDKLFSVIAHDLRGAVGGIRGLSEIICEPDPGLSVDHCRELAGDIHRTAAATGKLLEDLLSWSRFEAGHLQYKPALLSARAVIQEVVDLVSQSARGKGVTVSWSANDSLPVMADHNMLRSILQNFATNAIKFTPSGGTVRIAAASASDATLFTVNDTGVGMDAAQVERHGGHIEVRSQPHQGSCFSFTLPASAANRA